MVLDAIEGRNVVGKLGGTSDVCVTEIVEACTGPTYWVANESRVRFR